MTTGTLLHYSYVNTHVNGRTQFVAFFGAETIFLQKSVKNLEIANSIFSWVERNWEKILTPLCQWSGKCSEIFRITDWPCFAVLILGDHLNLPQFLRGSWFRIDFPPISQRIGFRIDLRGSLTQGCFTNGCVGIYMYFKATPVHCMRWKRALGNTQFWMMKISSRCCAWT